LNEAGKDNPTLLEIVLRACANAGNQGWKTVIVSFIVGRFGRDESWARMNPRRYVSLFLLIIVAALLTACHGNPNVRKQKYLESGKRFSAEGKYREAAIQYLNALKVDSDFSAAHYELEL
jgi:hypothetical protein